MAEKWRECPVVRGGLGETQRRRHFTWVTRKGYPGRQGREGEDSKGEKRMWGRKRLEGTQRYLEKKISSMQREVKEKKCQETR